ncbi:Helix-turn-helix domain-containing protein [Paenibacillus sp. yr247]|uniref:AraC family transcriptional regulator n=1 Tax=Paenibacillus sp. yr247 TaxID=1761880 RepID=UPI00088AE8FF|nr:AraC family transcriptional regulator [Paenibacillus sp. yr247]SDP17778.1 Helix-turn-helix domain-containing protein [Paenibacillus sp. yr247]
MLEANLNTIDEQINFDHLQKQAHNIDFHLHRGCEIYFLIQGDVQYFVEKSVYPIAFGDLIITNEHEIHKPSFLSNALYERISFQFIPALMNPFRTEAFDPVKCFYNRPHGEQNKVTLSPREVASLRDLFAKYDELSRHPAAGSELLKLSCLIELLVFVNGLYTQNRKTDDNRFMHEKLSPVLDYIEAELDGDLSLDHLAKHFYINKYYLMKLFKTYTGSTIHEYVISKRIAAAKRLLSEGCNVTEACYQSGFRDYTAFLKMFKKKVGLLPKDYV